jgi:cation diffusion facilitator family transporter
MHHHTLHHWQHDHVFLGEDHDRHERRTWLVVGLTAAMMVAEIVAGTIFGSMALVADGWHMSTHAAALATAALAYRFARKHAHDPRFSFGTGKVGELAAFSSAIILALIALLIGYESLVRLMAPVPIQFGEATVVAVIGLAVNLASAWLLAGGDHHHGHHHHDHGHHHDHEDHHHHGHAHGDHHGGDTNIRAAYLHVLADALTSVLAIVALLAGRFYGWSWLDPVMGVVGALVIARWSWGLIRMAGATLLDAVPDQTLAQSIRERIEIREDRVTDLHLWRLGPGHAGLIVSVVSDAPQAPDVYKQRLSRIEGLSHVTVEVHACPNHPRREAA